MTHLQQFKAMLEEAGVPFKVDPLSYVDPPNIVLTICNDSHKHQEENDPLIGYYNFEAVFKFSPEEKLIQVGIWE